MSAAVALCRFDDIPDGAARGFDPDDRGRDTIFVVRKGPRLYGWQNRCPHRGHEHMAWVKDGFLTPDGARIVCGAHGALYEIETGVCVDGPCVGRSLTPVPLLMKCGTVYLDRG